MLLKKNRLFNFLIAHSTLLYISWVIFIGILTLLPGSVIPNISWDFISIDKTVHIVLFTVLVFLGLIGAKYGKLKLFGKWPVITSISAAIIYGYLIEFLQSFVPQRSYDFADLTADCVGTIVGYGLFLGVTKILLIKER